MCLFLFQILCCLFVVLLAVINERGVFTLPLTKDVTRTTKVVSMDLTHEISTDPTQDISADATPDISTLQMQDISADPTPDISTDQTQDISADPTQDISTDPKHYISADPTQDISTDSTGTISTDLVTVESTEATTEIPNEFISRHDIVQSQASHHNLTTHQNNRHTVLPLTTADAHSLVKSSSDDGTAALPYSTSNAQETQTIAIESQDMTISDQNDATVADQTVIKKVDIRSSSSQSKLLRRNTFIATPTVDLSGVKGKILFSNNQLFCSFRTLFDGII